MIALAGPTKAHRVLFSVLFEDNRHKRSLLFCPFKVGALSLENSGHGGDSES